MSEIADRYRRRADAFERLIAGVRPEQWSNPSPCEKWAAVDVVDHVVGMHGIMLRPAGHEPRPGAGHARRPVGRLPRRSGRRGGGARRSRRRRSRGQDPGRTHDGGAPDRRGRERRPAQHGWDLARATGQDDTIDPRDVERLWAVTTAIPADLMEKYRTPGAFGPGIEVFGPEVEVPADAPLQDRLLGLIGRDPAWTPHPPAN